MAHKGNICVCVCVCVCAGTETNSTLTRYMEHDGSFAGKQLPPYTHIRAHTREPHADLRPLSRPLPEAYPYKTSRHESQD